MSKNKKDLINALAEKSEITKKDAEKHITNLLDIIMESVANDETVKIIGFGSFEKKPVKGTSGKIQFGERKGETWTTEDSFKVKFSAGKLFSDKVAGV